MSISRGQKISQKQGKKIKVKINEIENINRVEK